jgi:uncharacterized protein YbdZ (MbtH family)
MSRYDADREDTTTYKVVMNHEEQYSIWPEYKENPPKWNDVGVMGTRDECLAYIKEVWTDMRPLSLRKRMEEMGRNPPPLPLMQESDGSKEDSLVDRLSQGEHPIEVALRPEKAVKHFKQALDRDYVYIKFKNTRGGTELGVKLDRDACDFSRADFEQSQGMVHLEGGLTLDCTEVRCIADVALSTLEGKGHLTRAQTGAEAQ